MPQIDLVPYKEDPSLSLLAWEFGEMLARRGAVPPDYVPAVTLLGAKCLQAVDNGHSCLDLKDWSNTDAEKTEHISDCSPVSSEEWEKLIDMIGGIASEKKDAFTPLYFDREHHLLYLRKYYLAEQRIAEAVLSRLEEKTGIVFNDELKNRIHGISRLYAATSFDQDLQQQAVAMALTNRFSILTGGPGTGKTTTLAAFLALVLSEEKAYSSSQDPESEEEQEPNLRIALAAPTGKAAVQMKDSLADELRNNLQNISEETGKRIRELPSSTLHRLLGIGADGAKPRFDRTNVLPYDLIVVDEVSMASLKLLDMLFDALSPECRVLLIGDQYQLASVESGSVLGDFCSRCRKLLLSANDSPDQRHITCLWKNHRANILALKEFLRKMNEGSGQTEKLTGKLKNEIDDLYERKVPDFAALELSLPGESSRQREFLRGELEKQIDSMLKTMELPEDFEKYFGKKAVENIKFGLAEWRELKSASNKDMSTKEAQLPLALSCLYLNSFRVICAVHAGLFGERSINRMIADLLGKKNRTDGTPLIVLQNDSETGLYNGDTGIFWNGRIYFPEWKVNELLNLRVFTCSRSFLPDQMPETTLAYAMTIHKSQGSGYDNVLMILPDLDSRIITRELIYTGISRTKKHFMLWGKRNIFEAGIDRPTVRWSGLPYRFE